MSTLNADGVDDYAQFTAVNRAADTSWRIEIVVRNKETVTANVDQYLLGINGSLNDYILVKWTALPASRIEYRVDGSGYVLEWSGAQYVDTSDGALHTYVLTYNGGTSTLSATLDGVAANSTVSVAGLTFKDFTSFFRASANYGDLDLQYFRYYDTSAGDTLIYDWDADQSTRAAGGQPVLTDAASANDATGVNFPTDGSAWSDLSGGVTVNDTVANINITSIDETVTVGGVITVNDTVANINIGSIDETIITSSTLTVTISNPPADGPYTANFCLASTGTQIEQKSVTITSGSFTTTLNVIPSTPVKGYVDDGADPNSEGARLYGVTA